MAKKEIKTEKSVAEKSTVKQGAKPKVEFVIGSNVIKVNEKKQYLNFIVWDEADIADLVK